MRKQRTFSVDGERIQIISTIITSLRNFAGWRIKINDLTVKVFEACSRAEAEDRAYEKWLQQKFKEEK